MPSQEVRDPEVGRPQPTVAIADSFFEAFEAVPRKVQRKVREFLTRFREDPRARSINYESIASLDPQVRTVRIGDDYRGIVLHPESGAVYILVWVDHHDEAMNWARRKRFDIHPRTGALQCLSVDERGAVVAPVIAVAEATPAPATPPLFASFSRDQLFDLGVPEALLPAVATIRSEAELDLVARDFPAEASEALYGLAAGMSYQAVKTEIESRQRVASIAEAVRHPDSLRRFVIVDSDADLQAMLDAPMARWRIFLHPTQRRLVQQECSGSFKVTGGAGTGKTVVAVHRAVHLVKNVFPAAQDRVLFTTFTRNLAEAIAADLTELDPLAAQRIAVRTLNSIAAEVLHQAGLSYSILENEAALWREAMGGESDPLPSDDPGFYAEEFSEVVLAQDLHDLAGYLVARRLGRKGQLPRPQRPVVWRVIERFQALCSERKQLTFPMMVAKAASYVQQPHATAYRAVVVDEAQDMTAADWRLIRGLVPTGANDLFIVGDAHQRIYGRAVALGRCGIQVTGRSRRLRINYRTTEEIRGWACGLLEGLSFDDLDGQPERQDGYTSLMHGPKPTVVEVPSISAALEAVTRQIQDLLDTSVPSTDIGVVAARHQLLNQLVAGLDQAGIPILALGQSLPGHDAPGVRLATFHRVKGLEFRHLVVVCSDTPQDPLDPRERCQLYVAATRARDGLLVCRVTG